MACCSNDPSRRGGLGIAGIERSLWLDEENVGLLYGNGPVLDSFGNDENFARPDRDIFVSKLNVDPTAENEKKIIRVVVLMPYEFALDLDHHEIVSVEPTDDAGLPVVRERLEPMRKVDGFHGCRSLKSNWDIIVRLDVDRGRVPSTWQCTLEQETISCKSIPPGTRKPIITSY